MAIDPTQSQPTPKPGLGRLGRSLSGGVHGTDGRPRPATRPVPPADDLQISPMARELQEILRSDSANETAELSPEKFREVLDRIRSGYYDRPEVREEILQKLAGELGIA
ncbi:MAG: hypothetical protein ACE15D_10795 [Candidatus Eisenbacteria bacterium]|nr:hypothetical protein [Candidatus Eisenbacteria bacterium]